MDEFCGSKHQFWFLNKIKGVRYNNGKYFSDFHFINKSTADDIFHEEDGDEIVISLSVAFYTFFNVGCIFSRDGYLLARAPYTFKTNQNTSTLSIENFPEAAFLNAEECENSNTNFFPFDIVDCKHYIFDLKIDERLTKVLIPERVICSYIFFRNLFVTKKILDDSLLDCFDLSNFDSVKLDNDQEALRIFYNNRKILPQEAYLVAQFFNIRNGTKSINSISGNLVKSFTELKDHDQYPSIRADLDFMKDIEIEVTGKSFENKSETFFYVYEVTTLICSADKLSKYDNILLTPIFKDNNYRKLLLHRSLENQSINTLRYTEKKFSIYDSLRPVFYTGTDVYVMEYNTSDSDKCVLLKDFYSFHIKNKSKAIKTSALSTSLLRNFKKLGLKASILHYNSLDKIISRLKVANSEYSAIIFDLEYMSQKFYYVELSYDFILLMYNEAFKEILLIDLILVLENIIHNFSLENNRFRSFQKFDTNRYYLKFGITVLSQDNLIEYRESVHRDNAYDYVERITHNIKDEILI